MFSNSQALAAITIEIRSATSSMTSVPKPLKYLRTHYNALKARFESMHASADKVHTALLRMVHIIHLNKTTYFPWTIIFILPSPCVYFHPDTHGRCIISSGNDHGCSRKSRVPKFSPTWRSRGFSILGTRIYSVQSTDRVITCVAKYLLISFAITRAIRLFCHMRCC